MRPRSRSRPTLLVAVAVTLCALLAFASAPTIVDHDTGPPMVLELTSHPADFSPGMLAPIEVTGEAFAPIAIPFQPVRYESASSGVGRRARPAILFIDLDALSTAVRFPLLC